MDSIQWKVQSVIDAHTHYRGREPIAHYLENLAMANHARGVILTWRGSVAETGEGDSVYRFLREFKAGHPGRFYVFGGLAHDPRQVAKGDGRSLAPQVAKLIACGFDGIKMMEGSPYFKKELPHPLDHEYYRPFWDAAEAQAMPITMHLANPMDCWWTDAQREVYRDAEPQEEYFRQAEAVLAAHPRLRITFAHFMFLAPQLDRLDRLFSTYPELRVDLAMGQEFVYYLSDDVKRSRQFFIKWADRILYGTDVSDTNSVRLARAKADTVRAFLEDDGPFIAPYALALDKPEMKGSNGRSELQGLNLPIETLQKILRGNVEAWLGPTPRPLPVS
jgi:predicted TIM-barrel fold metal-dependent hydrolase